MDYIEALYHFITAILAILIYGYPARKILVIAVTGTSGKTTTSHLIYSILKEAGKKVSLISSVTAIIGGQKYDTGFHVTTPTPFLMQKLLKKAVNAKDEYIIIEASSHGIAQFRLLGTNVKIGVLTNIAHEHLDWHKTFSNYARSKLSLIAKSKIAVVNRDDKSYWMLLKYHPLKAHVITFSLKDKEADFTFKKLAISKNLPGKYNQENIMAAYSVASILGINNIIIKKAITSFPGVIGRFEEIKNNRGFRIIIDFAHKPNALKELLITLRQMAKKRIIIVFGSAGERDKLKRGMMGEIAGKFSDISILTAEDPRTEDVNAIIEEIAQGCIKAGAKEGIGEKNGHYFIRIPDRAKAIDFAINKVAQKDDIVAFLGKSHEKSMCYGRTEYPWSEHEAIYQALAKS